MLTKLTDNMTLEFGMPIHFTIKQHLLLINNFVKESNKLQDLTEFKKQIINIYISTDTEEMPGPLNHQYHKVINFEVEPNGYGKEF